MKIHPLKIYILQNKITQKQLGVLSGVSEITIHRIINYKTTRMFKKTIQKLQTVTGITITDLLCQGDEDT